MNSQCDVSFDSLETVPSTRYGNHITYALSSYLVYLTYTLFYFANKLIWFTGFSFKHSINLFAIWSIGWLICTLIDQIKIEFVTPFPIVNIYPIAHQNKLIVSSYYFLTRKLLNNPMEAGFSIVKKTFIFVQITYSIDKNMNNF